MPTNQTTTTARTSEGDASAIVRTERRTTGSAFRLLLWSPAIAIVLSALAVPGGLLIFGLSLLALGYVIFALIAQNGPGGSRESAVQRARVNGDTRPRP